MLAVEGTRCDEQFIVVMDWAAVAGASRSITVSSTAPGTLSMHSKNLVSTDGMSTAATTILLLYNLCIW